MTSQTLSNLKMLIHVHLTGNICVEIDFMSHSGFYSLRNVLDKKCGFEDKINEHLPANSCEQKLEYLENLLENSTTIINGANIEKEKCLKESSLTEVTKDLEKIKEKPSKDIKDKEGIISKLQYDDLQQKLSITEKEKEMKNELKAVKIQKCKSDERIKVLDLRIRYLIYEDFSEDQNEKL